MITPKPQQYPTSSNQSGFTIVESLMAIVVAAILMTAIAPVIVLSVATRVQARRVEVASLAARTYIDGIKSGVINAPSTVIQRTPSQYFLDSVNPPAASTTALGALYCVDLDSIAGCSSTSPKDLAVQSFRSVISTSPETDPQKGYRLGLRVYRADAFSDNAALTKGTKQATFTGGLGNRKAPLVEMTTEIRTEQTTFQDLRDRLGGS